MNENAKLRCKKKKKTTQKTTLTFRTRREPLIFKKHFNYFSQQKQGLLGMRTKDFCSQVA